MIFVVKEIATKTCLVYNFIISMSNKRIFRPKTIAEFKERIGIITSKYVRSSYAPRNVMQPHTLFQKFDHLKRLTSLCRLFIYIYTYI